MMLWISMLCAAASVAVMLVLIVLLPREVIFYLGVGLGLFGLMTCVFLEIFQRRANRYDDQD